MTIRTTNGESPGASEGLAVNTTSTADAGSFPISTVGSAGTRVFAAAAAAHGSWGYRVTPSGVSGTVGLLWSSSWSSTRVSARAYFRFLSAPTIDSYVTLIYAGSTAAYRLQLLTSGAIAIQNYTGGVVATSPVLTAGTFYRLDMVVERGTTTSNGVSKLRISVGDSTTPVYEFASSSVNSGTANLTNWQLGKMSGNTASFVTDWDDLVMSDETSDFIGPVVTIPPATHTASFVGVRRDLSYAFIGDSTMADAGESALRSALSGSGFTGAVSWYAVGSKAIDIPDSNGKTTLQNITDARATLGGEPTGGWVINLGSNGDGSTDATNTARWTSVMDAIDPATPVVWVGIANGPGLDSARAADRVRLNNLFRSLCATRANATWADWPTYASTYSSLGLWTSDNLHHTSAGSAVKRGFYVRGLPGPSAEVPGVLKLWDGSGENASRLAVA